MMTGFAANGRVVRSNRRQKSSNAGRQCSRSVGLGDKPFRARSPSAV